MFAPVDGERINFQDLNPTYVKLNEIKEDIVIINKGEVLKIKKIKISDEELRLRRELLKGIKK